MGGLINKVVWSPYDHQTLRWRTLVDENQNEQQRRTQKRQQTVWEKHADG